MGSIPSLPIEEVRSREAGFRNFTSFIFVCYFANRMSLRRCGKVLGLSFAHIRGAMAKRGWRRRTLSQAPKGSMRNRTIDMEAKIRAKDPKRLPWCSVYHYYHKVLLDTYDLGRLYRVSQTSIIKIMRRYRIERRNPATRKFF